MIADTQIPHAWQTVVDGDAPLKRLYILTTLAEHPHMAGFDPTAKKELLEAAASAVAADNELQAFQVVWEIRPARDPLRVWPREVPDRREKATQQQFRRRRTDRFPEEASTHERCRRRSTA